MAVLTCGSGGSNGQEIVEAINANTAGVAANVTTIDDISTKLEIPRFFGAKISAVAVPDAYGVALVSLSVPSIPAGRYLVSYALQIDFNTVRDKQVAYRADLNGITGDELGQSVGVSSAVSKDETNYTYYKDFEEGAFLLEMYFRDVTTAQGFTLDYVDLMLQWVGDTPIP